MAAERGNDATNVVLLGLIPSQGAMNLYIELKHNTPWDDPQTTYIGPFKDGSKAMKFVTYFGMPFRDPISIVFDDERESDEIQSPLDALEYVFRQVEDKGTLSDLIVDLL